MGYLYLVLPPSPTTRALLLSLIELIPSRLGRGYEGTDRCTSHLLLTRGAWNWIEGALPSSFDPFDRRIYLHQGYRLFNRRASLDFQNRDREFRSWVCSGDELMGQYTYFNTVQHKYTLPIQAFPGRRDSLLHN